MKKLKSLTLALTLCAMSCLSVGEVEARERCTTSGGCAYASTYETCWMAPAIGLGIAAIAVIVAVGLNNSGKSSAAHNTHSG